MSNKNADVVSNGLKCDNPNCDWIDESIGFDGIEEWINRPCPKCGENLLTFDDYKRFKASLEAIEIVNFLSESEIMELAALFPGDNAIKDVPGYADIENLPKDSKVVMSIETHKEIKIVGIKPAQ